MFEKSQKKVSFNIASEASYVYIFIKNAKKAKFWRIFENWWTMPKLQDSNETFLSIFKQGEMQR